MKVVAELSRARCLRKCFNLCLQLSKPGTVTTSGHDSASLKEKITQRRPREQGPPWMCQQAANARKTEKWSVSKARSRGDSWACTLHLHRRKCIACTVRVKSHTLIFMTVKQPHVPPRTYPCFASVCWYFCALSARSRKNWQCKHGLHLHFDAFLRLFITPKPRDLVICIYMRGLVQARGLLAHGLSPLTLDMPPQAAYVLLVFVHRGCQVPDCYVVCLSRSHSPSPFVSVRHLRCHRQHKVAFLCPASPSLLPHYPRLSSIFGRLSTQLCLLCVLYTKCTFSTFLPEAECCTKSNTSNRRCLHRSRPKAPFLGLIIILHVLYLHCVGRQVFGILSVRATILLNNLVHCRVKDVEHKIRGFKEIGGGGKGRDKKMGRAEEWKRHIHRRSGKAMNNLKWHHKGKIWSILLSPKLHGI